MRLDLRTIAAAALPKGKADHIFWDDELPGFGLRLRAGGHRSWVLQYRTNGHTRRASIAVVAKLGPAEARQAARKLLARVALGGDPQEEKASRRRQASHTFRSVVDAYLAAKRPELRPISYRISQLYLTGPYFERLHPLGITAITRADVATCIRAVVNKHSAPTAAAARRALSAFFAWAIADGLLGNGANPVAGSHRPADPKPRVRVLTDSELVAIWNAVGSDGDYGRVIRLLTLIGARASEVGGMRWSELDLDVGTWTLPTERSKNRRAHTIALPAPALAIIESIPRTDRDHLFGTRADAGFTSWPWCKQELDRKIAGTVKPWRVHDVRRTVATRMADIGIEPHVIEQILNHVGGHKAGVAGIYNRSSYERPVKAALQCWSECVLALVAGRESKVVTLQRA
jgi:integrase